MPTQSGNEQYLVMSRHHDAPYMQILKRAELEERLKEEWMGYTLLDKLPDFEYFPEHSLFIFKGQVATMKTRTVTVHELE